MAMFRNRDTLGALEDLLDKERTDILAGNFSGLKRIILEKERLIRAAQSVGTGENLVQLKRKADRNQAMLMAAAQGVRAVQDRISQRLSATPSLQTYDRSGQVTVHGAGTTNLERRA